MNDIEYLLGSADICNLPMQPYSEDACAFTADFSARLLHSREARAYPDISALGFWCRKSNIQKHKQNFGDTHARVGRGLCFHIAPANIPVNFAFSYLFGLLAGNANLVRLPSKEFGQTQPILEALRLTLESYPSIQKRTAFVRYRADNEISAEFSRRADARLIWGGDQTVANIRALPAMPRCIDIAFADRYSICILNGNAVLRATEAELQKLSEGFYNDTYMMDQNACSSPQLVLWLEDSNEARIRFWRCVETVVRKRYVLQAAVAVDKYTHMCEDALTLLNLRDVIHADNLLYRVQLDALAGDISCLRGQGGYFYECSMDSLNMLKTIVTEKMQTVVCYGINMAQLRDVVVQQEIRGIDRIVPVGKALDIDIIWDGHDLAAALSRIVRVEE